MPEAGLLLDTCALLWLDAEPRRLSGAARDAIDAADLVFVSAISAWEVSLKEARGALSLPQPVEEWFPAVLEAHHLRLAGLDIGVLMAANRLPFHHRDPADRFIIATAKRDGLTVVTGDRRFAAYGVRVVC
jgi:PIN domain nuclease of toxin-antitoxin system